MTTQTEALELALETLETSARNWPSDSVIEAITAIKEVLAQPEQERCVGCEACIDTACGRDECPKGWPKAVQPEQDPVACVVPQGATMRLEWASVDAAHNAKIGPLYTTPPQRTDQEQQIETLKRCLFQMQEAAKDLVEQAKSLTPPQRPWVGLSEKEAHELWESTDSDDDWELMKRTEAKLKEKNT